MAFPRLRLSGGEQQRLAIARTLAYDPAVILYDEPTSGLDRATAERVARLIRSTQDHHPKTSIVVTHDFETLAPIADHVYLLDSSKKELREIPPEQWKDLGEMMRSLAVEDNHVERGALSPERDLNGPVRSVLCAYALPSFAWVRPSCTFSQARPVSWRSCWDFRPGCCRFGGVAIGGCASACTICASLPARWPCSTWPLRVWWQDS